MSDVAGIARADRPVAAVGRDEDLRGLEDMRDVGIRAGRVTRDGEKSASSGEVGPARMFSLAAASGRLR